MDRITTQRIAAVGERVYVHEADGGTTHWIVRSLSDLGEAVLSPLSGGRDVRADVADLYCVKIEGSVFSWGLDR